MSNQIVVTPILLSVCQVTGNRIETWELEYPRFIHSEVLTHRFFSRNAASSRAIPIDKVMEQVMTDPAMPIKWGLNQSGMQSKLEHAQTATCIWAWKMAAKLAVRGAKVLQGLGLHKQVVNRILEPFVRIKVVVTSTEWDNWYHLRNHPDAQPEIHELARMMLQKRKEMADDYLILRPGQWHMPYVHTAFDGNDQLFFADEECTEEITLESALKISSSCCAQVSYRLTDQSMEKATKIWNQLVGMTPAHSSPMEHQAKVMSQSTWFCKGGTHSPSWEKGTTHVDGHGQFWSGNFKGYIQHRQLIPNHVCTNYQEK